MDSKIIDSEYIILENIYDSAVQKTHPLRQRDLAQIAGTSLGMTNSILKRLAKKGWITIKKLNSRNIQYAVTLEGLNEIIRRSYRYFKRTIKNAVFYKDSLEGIVKNALGRDVHEVLLVGGSDLDFIIEHVCRRYGLSFMRSGNNAEDSPSGQNESSAGTLRIYSENYSEQPGEKQTNNRVFLSSLIMQQAASSKSSQPN
ncbi:MAG: winged helix-turn-helix transcriptional regulator [Treponema sp.]|jgi:DNA-binding MarR family transcriptional regulator|nr:winged helix-turn-helix transcriptional regulator [Treponema sp.]